MKQKTRIDLQNVLRGIARKGLSKRRDFKEVSGPVLAFCQDAIQEAVRNFKTPFLAQASGTPLSKAPSIMPDGVKFFQNNGDTLQFLIEQKPTVRTLKFATELSRGCTEFAHVKHYNNYRLALPYVVFLIKLGRLSNGFALMDSYVYYRNESINSLDDILYFPNFPNVNWPSNMLHLRHMDIFISDRGDFPEIPSSPLSRTGTETRICRGVEFSGSVFNEISNTSAVCQNAIAHFWSSSFNTDYLAYYHCYSRRYREIRSPEFWKLSTEVNPLFPLDLKWVPCVKISDIFADQNQSSNADISQHVTSVFDEAWRTVQNEFMSSTEPLDKIFVGEMDKVLQSFSVHLVRNLSVIRDDTVRRTVQLAVSQALSEAVKGANS